MRAVPIVAAQIVLDRLGLGSSDAFLVVSNPELDAIGTQCAWIGPMEGDAKHDQGDAGEVQHGRQLLQDVARGRRAMAS